MNWHHWLRIVACSGFLVLAYANAAHSDEHAHQQVLAVRVVIR